MIECKMTDSQLKKEGLGGYPSQGEECMSFERCCLDFFSVTIFQLFEEVRADVVEFSPRP